MLKTIRQMSSREMRRRFNVDTESIRQVENIMKEIDPTIWKETGGKRLTLDSIEPRAILSKLKNTILELETELNRPTTTSDRPTEEEVPEAVEVHYFKKKNR